MQTRNWLITALLSWLVTTPATATVIASTVPISASAARAADRFDGICKLIKKQETAVEAHITANYSGDASLYVANSALFDVSDLRQFAGTNAAHSISKVGNTPEIRYNLGTGNSYSQLDGVLLYSTALLNGSNEIIGWARQTDLDTFPLAFVTCDVTPF